MAGRHRVPRQAPRACGHSRRRRDPPFLSPTISSRPGTPFEAAQCSEHVAAFFAGCDGEASGDERILRLIGADQRQAHVVRASVRDNLHALRKAVVASAPRVAASSPAASRPSAAVSPRFLRRGDDVLCAGAICIDDRGLTGLEQLGEKAELRLRDRRRHVG